MARYAGIHCHKRVVSDPEFAKGNYAAALKNAFLAMDEDVKKGEFPLSSLPFFDFVLLPLSSAFFNIFLLILNQTRITWTRPPAALQWPCWPPKTTDFSVRMLEIPAVSFPRLARLFPCLMTISQTMNTKLPVSLPQEDSSSMEESMVTLCFCFFFVSFCFHFVDLVLVFFRVSLLCNLDS